MRRIVSWYKCGLTPEEIGDRIGHFTLAEVYAALTYYQLEPYWNSSPIEPLKTWKINLSFSANI